MTKADERRNYDVDDPETAWAKRLRARYGDVAQEPLPDTVRDLLAQLAAVESRRRQN